MPVNDDLDGLLETALARAGGPLNVAAVLKALPAGRKPARKEVQARLGQLVDSGRIHRWPGAAEKFAAFSPQTFAREQVLRALSSGPLTEAEIKQHVPASAKALVKPALVVLVSERAVRKHPKLGKRVPLGLGPPDAADYLPAEIATMFKRLVKMGFEESGLPAALRRHVSAERDDGPQAAIGAEEILAAMHRLNSQVIRGALVDVADLRAALAPRFRDKESFDRAIIDLVEHEKVQLQTHAWPGRLTDVEKRALIPNGRGGWFDVIGLRLE